MIEVSREARRGIDQRGFAAVAGRQFDLAGFEDSWTDLARDFEHLRVDAYMADRGRYRLRRFGRFRFVPATRELARLPHATVFQPTYINHFAGGIHRDFAPLRDATFDNKLLRTLIELDFSCFRVPDEAMRNDPWEVWIHQIRIETAVETVAPAPEGVHHDGHDFIAMHLIKRDNVAGGLNRIYDNEAQEIETVLLEAPLDTIFADDHRVMHGVEGVRAADDGRPARRDMLIIDFDHRPGLSLP